MITYANPLKPSLDDYSRDELYQLVIEELPTLRAIAEAAMVVKQFDQVDNSVDLPVSQNLFPALKRWEDCIGSQLDARNG